MSAISGPDADIVCWSKKGREHLLQERWEIFRFIKDHRSLFPIEMMCNVLKVSKSGFYAWLKSKPSMRTIENDRLSEKITEIYVDSKCTYGSPRIREQLRINAFSVSRPRVARLMKKAHLRAKQSRRFKVTTDSKHNYMVSDNLLNRNFSAPATGQAWVSDMTYIRTIRGWLYLTIVLDLADRKIIGWALSSSMQTRVTTVAALQMALKNRPVLHPLLFHSDRGVQYACEEFRNELKVVPLISQSMSRKGNCWDNAVAESFFKTVKTECVYSSNFADQQQAKVVIFEYMEVFYNRKRLHSALGYRSPVQMEKLLNQHQNAA